MIKYRDGYKYQLAQSHVVITPITGYKVEDEYYSLHETGILTIHKGYAWDGPSGVTFDTKSSMRPSLEHDAFCQMLRARQLPFELQDAVNKFFYEQCLDAGMWGWRAWLWYKAVEAADCGNPAQGPDRPIITAP